MKGKRAVLCFLGALAAALLAGCASRLSLEGWEWTMTAAFDGDGRVAACAPGRTDTYPDAKEMTVTFSAERGRLEITLEKGGETLAGTYRQIQVNPDGKLYELYVEGLGRGFGGCAYTKHATGENVPTFAAQFPGEYSFYFTGDPP